MPGVVVVGSANVDHIFRVGSIPRPGETVLAGSSSTARGGKGQNQAVAAARAGALTSLIAALGDDAFGAMTRSGLLEDGVDIGLLRTVPAPTGTAVIAVDGAGENTIIVAAGANALLAALTDLDRSAIATASVLVMQLEIPLDTVTDAAAVARASGTTVLLNGAPFQPLSAALLTAVDILVVNEHEAAEFAPGRPAAELTALVPAVVVTFGAAGAVLHRRGLPAVRATAPIVSAVDSTGAGDSFCGALAAALSERMAPEAALRFAVAAASLSVQGRGAVPSIPRRAAIDERLAATAEPAD